MDTEITILLTHLTCLGISLMSAVQPLEHLNRLSPQLWSLPTGSQTVTSECTALLGEVGFWRGSDSSFSLCGAPTYYCRSKYFYSQCPQVWNLIGTEHSLIEVSIGLRIKHTKSISNKYEIRLRKSE